MGSHVRIHYVAAFVLPVLGLFSLLLLLPEQALAAELRDGLRDGLAAATELGGVATAWSQAEELRGWEPAELGEILRELVELAKEAVGKGERLYCRVCV